MDKTIAIFGAGKIGDALVALLMDSGKYGVHIFDHNLDNLKKIEAKWKSKFNFLSLPFACTVSNIDEQSKTANNVKNSFAVISALPFFCNPKLAQICLEAGCHYFDLTEDVATTNTIKKIASSTSKQLVFMPQCGLAPGFISVASYSLAKHFEVVDTIKMRVGALPLFPSNRFKYNLTWSTEGLINEYINDCEVISNGVKENVKALEGEERFSLDGVEYEAFNTSGGLGTLCDTLSGKVKNLSYKSVRYPGHLDIFRFLMQDLKFNQHRQELKVILERAIPTTKQDKCIVYVEVTGTKDGVFTQETFAKTVYNQEVAGCHLGAIQITTASGILTPIDILLSNSSNIKGGFRVIEDISLDDFLKNPFGRYYN